MEQNNYPKAVQNIPWEARGRAGVELGNMMEEYVEGKLYGQLQKSQQEWMW
jgi:hypothetical protein